MSLFFRDSILAADAFERRVDWLASLFLEYTGSRQRRCRPSFGLYACRSMASTMGPAMVYISYGACGDGNWGGNMRPVVKTITLSLPFGLGRVNCYLLKTAGGYVLIDTGLDRQRAALEKQLARAGCEPGNLGLIVLTHGDVDHAANRDTLVRERVSAD